MRQYNAKCKADRDRDHRRFEKTLTRSVPSQNFPVLFRNNKMSWTHRMLQNLRKYWKKFPDSSSVGGDPECFIKNVRFKWAKILWTEYVKYFSKGPVQCFKYVYKYLMYIYIHRQNTK